MFKPFSFWEGSWEDGAQMWSSEKGAYDPNKIHKITYNGEFHKTSATCQSHPSPQRTPLLFQAGQSKSGREFAARHAEAVFCQGSKPSDLTDTIKEMRAMAIKEGRDPYDIKFFPGICPIIGRTLEEAQEKYRIAEEYTDWEGGLACLSGWTGVDLSQYPLDEPFDFEGKLYDNAIHGMVKATQNTMKAALTPRELGKAWAFGGFGQMTVGTPDMVADAFEEWIEEADIDGFNIACGSLFYSSHQFLVPVLDH
jgi:alkanesulfonate monooxygenase SsuD/methylene tetrahydromethanopterin reductase-like flavin-dependent oxidoreductase (luciferase family)